MAARRTKLSEHLPRRRIVQRLHRIRHDLHALASLQQTERREPHADLSHNAVHDVTIGIQIPPTAASNADC